MRPCRRSTLPSVTTRERAKRVSSARARVDRTIRSGTPTTSHGPLGWARDRAEAERVVGLYEFTFRDDKWLVGILYLDSVDAWGARHDEPLRDVGCGISPWGAG